jgi:hypothetical protein
MLSHFDLFISLFIMPAFLMTSKLKLEAGGKATYLLQVRPSPRLPFPIIFLTPVSSFSLSASGSPQSDEPRGGSMITSSNTF